MSYYNNCGYGGNYGGNYGGYGGQNDGLKGPLAILKRISLGTTISVHFDSVERVGRFLGIENGTVILLVGGTIYYISIKKITAVDIP
ncbi:hypothetical protein [Paenibacillus agilis]|uniref:DUF2642 domain-containing protein n=1 Tax=Paenibacillus agilis TaxID=3020863 RepID=A0A559IKV9_9BACL|nr:hypothetical protein [Paenibacillus agilis]TVX88298.1 hypothetical protein FPZ44_20635 [Paenibacillus agilis]